MGRFQAKLGSKTKRKREKKFIVSFCSYPTSNIKFQKK